MKVTTILSTKGMTVITIGPEQSLKVGALRPLVVAGHDGLAAAKD